jgi:hypothetical protein
MTADARRRLKSTADNTDMEMETIHDTIIVGNMEGLSYARRVDSLQVRLNNVEKRLDNTEKELSDTKQELRDTKFRVTDLEESAGYYGVLRNRFLSTFKRDKPKNATPADMGLIASGNLWAHEGNASRDADLYQSVGGRTDFATYKELYGLHPWMAREISMLIFES